MTSLPVNRMTRTVLALALTAPAAVAGQARGAESAAVPAAAPATATALGLDDAVRLAMHGNWDVLSSRTALAIAEAQKRTAREWPNPNASALVSQIHTDGAGDATSLGNGFWERAYDTVIQAEQLVELGGKRSARWGSARAGGEVARARMADLRRTLRADVVSAYAAAGLSESNASISRQSAEYLGEEARIAGIRWKAGDISKSDLDQIEIAAARLELDAATAETESRARRVDLELLLGLSQPVGTSVLADSLEALADRSEQSAPTGSAGTRADLAAARARLDQAASDLRLQRAIRVPDVTLVGQYEHEPPVRSNSVGAGLSLPIPLWNRNAGEIRAAEAAKEDAARAVRQIEAEIAAEIVRARAAYDEAMVRWKRYRDDLRPRSAEIRLTVSHAYEKGGASLLDLLQAERSDNDVRLSTMQAARDAVLAAAELTAATAPITEEDTQP